MYTPMNPAYQAVQFGWNRFKRSEGKSSTAPSLPANVSYNEVKDTYTLQGSVNLKKTPLPKGSSTTQVVVEKNTRIQGKLVTNGCILVKGDAINLNMHCNGTLTVRGNLIGGNISCNGNLKIGR